MQNAKAENGERHARAAQINGRNGIVASSLVVAEARPSAVKRAGGEATPSSRYMRGMP